MSETRTNGDVVIRRASIDDVPAIAECVRLTYEPYESRLLMRPGPMLDDSSAVVVDHNVHVAVVDGRIAALVVVITRDGGVLLDNVAVHPAAQGRGLGRRMIELAESEARRNGDSEIELSTHVLMVENAALYQRLGYEEIDRRIERGFERIDFRKRLAQA